MATTIEKIRLRPDLHVHNDTGELMNCCMKNGKLDILLMEAHGQFVDLGSNGGRRCDVLSGPCSCGAWHNKDKVMTAEIK